MLITHWLGKSTSLFSWFHQISGKKCPKQLVWEVSNIHLLTDFLTMAYTTTNLMIYDKWNTFHEFHNIGTCFQWFTNHSSGSIPWNWKCSWFQLSSRNYEKCLTFERIIKTNVGCWLSKGRYRMLTWYFACSSTNFQFKETNKIQNFDGWILVSWFGFPFLIYSLLVRHLQVDLYSSRPVKIFEYEK